MVDHIVSLIETKPTILEDTYGARVTKQYSALADFGPKAVKTHTFCAPPICRGPMTTMAVALDRNLFSAYYSSMQTFYSVVHGRI